MTQTPPSYNNMQAGRVIRVLIVDDSALLRKFIITMLKDVPDIEVVGEAADGQEALRMTTRLKPDVITMDIRMPKMDGLEATRHIMSIQPTPIIVVSSSVYATDYSVAFNAIEAGALTVIEKPKGLGMQDFDVVRDQLVKAIHNVADVKVTSFGHRVHTQDGIGPMTAMLHAYFSRPIKVVAIAASTGGPPVLMHLLSSLPEDFTIPIVIVQHILPPFVQGLVEWLDSRTKLSVQVAKTGQRLTPGGVWVSPGDTHMLVSDWGTLQLDSSDPVKGQRPSGTLLFESVAKTMGSNAVGMVLTGMGDDGADGLVTLSKTGAHIIAQNEASSIVFSMPKSAIDRRIVDEVLSPDEMVTRLMKLHRHMQSFV